MGIIKKIKFIMNSNNKISDISEIEEIK